MRTTKKRDCVCALQRNGVTNENEELDKLRFYWERTDSSGKETFLSRTENTGLVQLQGCTGGSDQGGAHSACVSAPTFFLVPL